MAMMHELPASPTSSSNETMSSSPTKKRKVGVPKFLRYLYQILEKEDSAIISWANGGTSIQILDTDRVAQYILPKYFKHSKYASFQRQLNYFGFRKWTKSQTNICTFSHPEFRQNRPDRLYLIKRKNSPESARKKPSSKTTSHEKTAPMPPMLHFQMRQHLHPMAPMSYDFLAPASKSSSSSSPSAGFQRALFPNDVLDFNPTKKESMLFGFQSKPSPTTTPLPSTHLLSDIENLQIQGDGPSFSLLDVNHMMFGGGASTPLPPSMLPDFKDSANETHFDFDMNCAWLDNFTPVDPVAYPNGPPFNHAEYA